MSISHHPVEVRGIEAGALVAPASFGQLRLWFLEQLAAESRFSAYNISVAFRVVGPLDERALAATLHFLSERHEALRTSLLLQGEKLVQVVAPSVRLEELRFDCSLAPSEHRRERGLETLREASNRAFSLATGGALCRFVLVREDHDVHALSLVLHHAVSDGWSADVLSRELWYCYGCFRDGRTPSLPELPIQCADFATWQHETCTTEQQEPHVAYFRSVLAGAPPELHLPRDHARAAWLEAGADQVEQALGARLSEGVRRVAGSLRATPFMLLSAALAVVLQRNARQDDFCLGYPAANRERPELQGVVGFLVNTLVLRVQIDASTTFDALVSSVRGRVLEASAHADLPFEKLVDVLAPERSLVRSPIFQVAVAMQSAELSLEAPGLVIEPLAVAASVPKFELLVSFSERSGEFIATFEYARHLFDRASVQRWAKQLASVLGAAVECPTTPLAALSLIDAEERRALLSERPRPLPARHVGLDAWFEQVAASHPERIALSAGNQQLSYAELNAHANRLARHLLALDLEPGARVALWLERSLEAIVSIVSIVKAGLTYVPFDADCPPGRVARALEDCGARCLLVDAGSSGHLSSSPELERLTSKLHLVQLDDASTKARIALEAGFNLARSRTAADVAYVIYTSGSSGVPKGCCVTHGNVIGLFEACESRFAFTPRDVWTLFHSLAFDFSVWEVWGALLHGSRLVVVPYWASRSADQFHALLQHERVSVLSQTPTAFAQLSAFDAERGGRLEHLRYVVLGGEALKLASLAGWFERYGERAPQLVNMYGITETTVHVTHRALTAADVSSTASLIGQPLPGAHIYLLDERGEPVSDGMVGEVFVAGWGVSAGYLNRPELASERFVSPAWAPELRLYRSGDLARRRGGELEFCGRADRQVKLRGFRIELGELEACCLSAPGIAAAAATLDERSGAPSLVAYVVAKDVQRLRDANACESLIDSVHRHLAACLPAHMLPSQVAVLPALPRTVNGKLDVDALPSAASLRSARPIDTAALTEAEQVMANVWRELLGLDRVGRTDNFFQCGGDSISSLQLVARARKRGFELTPRDVFEHPTLAGLCAVAKPPVGRNAVSPCHGDCPLLPLQRWFLQEQPETARNHFNFASFVPAVPRLTRAQLLAIANVLLARHDALRLRFTRDEHDEWHASYARLDAATVEGAVQVIDLRALESKAWRLAVQLHADAAQRHLDVAEGPLARWVWYRGGPDGSGQLLLIVHHLVVDVVSWGVLIDDLNELQGQLERGEALSLCSASSSLKEWAERLEHLASSAELRGERQHWLRVLRSGQPLLRNSPDLGARHADMRTVSAQLDSGQTSNLLTRCLKTFDARINELLLSALILAVHRSTGSERVLVDLEGHGREPWFSDIDLSQTVGFFTSKFPVALALPDEGERSLERVVHSVKAALRATPGAGLGYGILRYIARDAELAAAERAARVPICFNYLGHWSYDANDETEHAPLELCSPELRRYYALDVTAAVARGQFQIDALYDPSQFSGDQAQGFVVRLVEALAELIQAEPAQLGAASTGEPVTLPATAMQQGMVFRSLAGDDPAAYVVQYRYRARVARVEALHAAFAALAQRHAALRTAFASSECSGLVQVVAPHVVVSWKLLSGSPSAAEAALEADARQPFELEQAPLWRVLALPTVDGAVELAFTFHHAILDGWSMALLTSELRALLNGCALAPVVPHSEYVAWLDRQDRALAKAHFTRALTNAPHGFRAFGGGYGAAASQRRERGVLDAATKQRLVHAAAQAGVTFSTIVHAAWALTLAHHSGQPRVTFGFTSSGRRPTLLDAERIIGLLIASLPLCVDCGSTTTLDLWLKDLASARLDAEEHGHLPLAEIEKCVPGLKAPLFDTLVVFQNYPSSVPAGTDDALRELACGRDETHFGATLVVDPAASGSFVVSCREHLALGVSAASLVLTLLRALRVLATARGELTPRRALLALAPGPHGEPAPTHAHDEGAAHAY